jgi:hypothetical protein
MAKKNFDHIYVAPDPRSYYRTLGALDYQIPAHGSAVFGRLASECGAAEQPRVVDLCCSYGVNAALMNHDVELDDVVARYVDPDLDDLEPVEVLAADRDWFRERRCASPIHVCGVDSSEPAVIYGVEAGLLDVGFAVNLETDEPSLDLCDELRCADLAAVSGGIGYITATTIDKVFRNMVSPRLAALCLRWIDFASIVDVGAAYGLVTERLDEATFPQRRFSGDMERTHVHAELDGMRIDPTGRESKGYHHADLYVMRPDDEAAHVPLGQLLAPVSATGPAGRPVAAEDGVATSLFRAGNELKANITNAPGDVRSL